MISMSIDTWSDYKTTIITNKGLSLQYFDTADNYRIFATEAGIYVWEIILLKDAGSDVVDFENNYKADANQPLNPVDQNIGRLVGQKKSFSVASDLNSISVSTEHDYMLLKNPSGSAVKLFITHLNFGTDATNVRSKFRLYKNPTITTDGTGLTEQNTYIASSPPSAVATAFLNPTISARGGFLSASIMSANANSRGMNRYYWIEADNSILVTVENSVANAKSFADIYWIEGV